MPLLLDASVWVAAAQVNPREHFHHASEPSFGLPRQLAPSISTLFEVANAVGAK